MVEFNYGGEEMLNVKLSLQKNDGRIAGRLTRRTVCAVILAFLLVPPLDAQKRTLTLNQALEEAQTNNSEVLQVHYDLLDVRWSVRELQASHLPSISVNTMISHVGEVPAVPIELDDEQRLIQLGSASSFRTRLELEQKIFDFGRSEHNVRAARSGEEALQASYAHALNGLSVNVKQQYYSVLHYARLDSIYASIIDLSEKLAQISASRFEEGAILEPALLQARADVQMAAARRTEAQGGMARSILTLAQLMGSDRTDFVLVDPLPDFSDISIPSEIAYPLYSQAIASRPDFSQLRYYVSQQSELTRAIRAQLYPAMVFQADLTYYGPKSLFGDYSTFGGQGLRTYNWRVGFVFTYPLFDGSRTRAQEARATARMNRAEEQIRQRELEVRMNLEAAIGDLERRQLAYRSNASLHAFTQASLAMGEIQYQNGALPLASYIPLKIAEANSAILLEEQSFEITRLILLIETIVGQEVNFQPAVTTNLHHGTYRPDR